MSVGLAQNFAAIRALAVEGIQKGHMALHAKNIAVSARAEYAEINSVAEYLINTNKINKQIAQEYLTARRHYQQQHKNNNQANNEQHPSTLFVEVPVSGVQTDDGLARIHLFSLHCRDGSAALIL